MAETRVLLVDDDLEIVTMFARWLKLPVTAGERADGPAFEVETATDPRAALQLIEQGGPYALVVSDYQMPEMDGVHFLERVKTLSPLTTRIMVTGQADVTVALEAVNRGSVFRFLTKPCGPSIIASAVVAGLRQHQLLIAERQLLDETLGGAVRLLVEILTLVNPSAARRAQRTRRCVQHMVHKLHLSNGWQLEAAAMLSHLGSLTLGVADGTPTESTAAPSADAPGAVDDHAALAQRLLEQIPRLEGVAHIIGRQKEPVDAGDLEVPLQARDSIRLGGQILRVALEFDAHLATGASLEEVLQQLALRPRELDAELVRSLAGVDLGLKIVPMRLPVMAFLPGMIVDEDLHGENGVLLMKRGQELTMSMLARLKNSAASNWLKTTATVLVEKPPDAEPLSNPQIAAGQPAAAV